MDAQVVLEEDELHVVRDRPESRVNLTTTLAQTLERLPKQIKAEDVDHLINLQEIAMDRLENTNKSLADCGNLAQRKLATTSSLFKKTSRQMKEAKKEIDLLYKKITDLKAKIIADRPDLTSSVVRGTSEAL